MTLADTLQSTQPGPAAMTFADRVAALGFLGLTPRQTRFVATVALHGGYCLRRQYAAFSGIAHGKNPREFLETLVDRRLATCASYEINRGHVYHLRHKAIYEAIAQDENRNRRCASSALVARKIMLLDFVISQPDVEWFATEQDKSDLFLSRYQIPKTHWPHRIYPSADPAIAPTARYFVHKQPIYLAGDPPVPHFVCAVQEGTGQAFKQFLWDHAGLLTRLPAWAVVAVSPAHRSGLEPCASIFEQFVAGSLRPSGAMRPEDLRWYFGMRRAVDQRDPSVLSVSKIERFHLARRRFAGPLYDGLYAEWLTGGDDVLRRATGAQDHAFAPTGTAAGRLIMHELPFTYSQFGALSGIA